MTDKTYRIKPLVWREEKMDEHYAISSWGYFWVERPDEDDDIWIWGIYYCDAGAVYFDKDEFATADEAKAAAQAFHEARMREGLEEVK